MCRQADYAIPIPPFDGMARYRYVPACTHDPAVDTLISGSIHKYGSWMHGFHKEMRTRLPGGQCPPDRPVVRWLRCTRTCDVLPVACWWRAVSRGTLPAMHAHVRRVNCGLLVVRCVPWYVGCDARARATCYPWLVGGALYHEKCLRVPRCRCWMWA